MASLSFDATSIDTTSHEPIKAGTYEAVITASEIKANRANTGKGLNLTFEIISDNAKGRKVWAWINASCERGAVGTFNATTEPHFSEAVPSRYNTRNPLFY